MDRPTETPGFTIPVHRSLTEPMLVAGAPRGATIFNGTLAVALGLGMHAWLAAVVIWVFVQGACVLAARRDSARHTDSVSRSASAVPLDFVSASTS